MLEVQIFTLYPDLYPGLLDVGIYKKAKEKQKWSLKIIDIRDYAFDDNRTVDDTPFGGGNGMLLKPDVVASALDKNIKGKEKIYLPAYAIITANNIEEIIINVLTNFDIFFVEVLANQLSKI